MLVSALFPKSLAFAPLSATFEILKLAVPVLVTVSVCAALVVLRSWLVKVKPGEDKLATGPVPVPLKPTVWVLPVTALLLSVKISDALRLPAALGVNVTLTVQVPWGATLDPVQVSALLAKSPASVPLIAAVEILRLAVPVLVIVSVCAALVVLRSWLVKVKPGEDNSPRAPRRCRPNSPSACSPPPGCCCR